MLIQLWEFHLHNKKERARAAQHKAHHGDVITNRFEKKKNLTMLLVEQSFVSAESGNYYYYHTSKDCAT
jgi:hypothetical protein